MRTILKPAQENEIIPADNRHFRNAATGAAHLVSHRRWMLVVGSVFHATYLCWVKATRRKPSWWLLEVGLAQFGRCQCETFNCRADSRHFAGNPPSCHLDGLIRREQCGDVASTGGFHCRELWIRTVVVESALHQSDRTCRISTAGIISRTFTQFRIFFRRNLKSFCLKSCL